MPPLLPPPPRGEGRGGGNRTQPSAADLLAIYRLWRPQTLWLALGLAISLAAVITFVALLAQSGRTVAAALIAGLITAPLLLRLLGAARVLLRYLERLTTHEATFRALADLRVWFFRALSQCSAGGLGFRRSGDVLSRLVTDVAALDGLYLRITIPAAAAILLLILLPILIWPLGPTLTLLITLLFAAAAIAIPAKAATQALRATSPLANATAALRIAALDLLGGLREARAFGAEDRLLAELHARETTHQSAMDHLAESAARAQAAAFLCTQLALLCVLMVAATRGRADPIAMVALVFLLVAAFESVSLLPRAGALAGHAAASAHRVLQAATAPTEPVPAAPAQLPVSTALRFDQVHFTWPSSPDLPPTPNRPPIFDGLTLEIPRGARVAVLGPSGSGKSTLAALALRVALPQSGRVLLGGIDTATLRSEDVRTRFSWLSQSTHLFADTIRNNLLLARPDADPAALWTALDSARIADFVRSLPDQLDSWVGESGAQFSGGQSRRLVLARALLSAAPILILDEPCAGLDSQTEQEFLSTLNEVAPGRSLLLIVHRLTGVERLDRIYRLSNGHAIAAAG
jgi:ATP-binding cassette subfamily C protein CydC